MNTRNYQKELDSIIEKNGREGIKPSLLLHACCAPCASYCIEYLAEHFDITVFYYNPNISPVDEFYKRAAEMGRFLNEFPPAKDITMIVPPYDSGEFYDAAKGLENEPEGGARCRECFKLRLEKTAEYAKEQGFDFFTTTLTVSPLKNAAVLNETGEKSGEKYGVKFLPSDFKKKDGYKRTIVLSAQYGLYRQNYCGCEFSQREGEG